MLSLRSINGVIGYFSATITYGDRFYDYLNVIKKIPSRSWDIKNKIWLISIHDFDILKQEIVDAGLKWVDVDDGLKMLLSNYRKWCSDMIQLAALDDCELCVDENILKIPLFPHQRVVLKFLLTRKCALNCLEMGLGKSFPSLVGAEHLRRTNQAKSCLIVCPAGLKYNWKRYIDMYLTESSYVIIEGHQFDRAEQYMSKEYFKIISYEMLRNDIDKVLHDTQFDCIIADEVHRISSNKAKQSKALCKMGNKAKYRWGLTGTPVQNRLEDLHSIMKFINPNFFSDWWNFKERYCINDFFGNVASYRNLNEIHGRIQTIMVRKFKSDILKDLPQKIYSDVYVDFTKDQLSVYKKIKEKILSLDRAKKEQYDEDGVSDEDFLFDEACKLDDDYVETFDDKLARATKLSAFTYLRELCDSPELLIPEFKDSAKISELKQIVNELLENGHKIVIFSQFEKMTRIIERELNKPCFRYHGGIATQGGERDRMNEEFATSKDKNVFIMTTAGGEGLNLPCADYIIFFDLLFNPKKIEQIEDRLHRIGQKKTVNVIRLIVRDSIEDRIFEILRDKIKLYNEVINGEKIDESGSSITQKELLQALRNGV